MKIDLRKRIAELDAQPFTDFTAGYAPEIQQWWDALRPLQLGRHSREDTTAFVGACDAQGMVSGDDSKRCHSARRSRLHHPQTRRSLLAKIQRTHARRRHGRRRCSRR